ncbi:MAG: TetR/AcrR family transcriptional regulator, partial [Dysgonamonadaceae bacterium]|nr:TetR/AcrR family transcriptional regulator [Dysgonamonadaceae bacterium]
MELRERIIESASELFFHKGIKSMSMSDIANAAGISKRTLYEVFRDKEELLETCIKSQMEKTERELEALSANSTDVIETLMQIHARHLKEMRNVNPTLIHDLQKYHPLIH